MKERISVLESNINLNANFSQLKLLLSIIKIIEINVSNYFLKMININSKLVLIQDGLFQLKFQYFKSKNLV
jgi:hypothetical protein